MGKLDELLKSAGSIAAESMGAGRVPGAGPRAAAPSGAPGPDRMEGLTRSRNAAEIPLAKIIPDPAQPREDFSPESLERLAQSLRSRGQLQPIRVRWDEAAGRYVIICGERRWRAAELAGLPTMTAIISDAPTTPAELLALQIVENTLREDLSVIEQAKAFRMLMETNGWSTRQLAAELAVTQSGVVRALALLDLPGTVQEHVDQGTLAPATAYELSKVEDPDVQRSLAERVVSEGLNRSEVVEAVRTTRPSGKGRGVKPKAKGKPERLPAEMKHRGPAGCKITVTTAARHTLADVVADLRAFLERLESEMGGAAQDAA